MPFNRNGVFVPEFFVRCFVPKRTAAVRSFPPFRTLCLPPSLAHRLSLCRNGVLTHLHAANAPHRLKEMVLKWLPVTHNQAIDGEAPSVGDTPIKTGGWRIVCAGACFRCSRVCHF